MKKYIPIGLRIIVAGILIQTLRFKFTAHPDSVHIFTQVGLEPYGRIGIGVLELITGVLLLIRKTAWVGTLFSIGILSSAVFTHLTKIGVQVNNDGGILFITAISTLSLSILILYIYRKEIPYLSI